MIDLSIRVSPSRNVQGSGAFKKLGGFIKPLGNEAFLIADEIVTSLVDMTRPFIRVLYVRAKAILEANQAVKDGIENLRSIPKGTLLAIARLTNTIMEI